jgi:hypothetical protein
MSAAVTVRLVAERRRTVLFDEIDAVYGTVKRQEANGELVAFMNAGYRRGAKAHRCATGNGSKHEAIVFEAYAPLAVAGLHDLPDALATRAIIIRMRRRAPDEQVEHFRIKHHVPEAKPIREALEEWCEVASTKIGDPVMPDGVVDRAFDIWEPLIAIADVAGDLWPTQAREAAVYFTRANAEEESRSHGVELLSHIREVFGSDQRLAAKVIIDRLCELPESPWKDIRGKPLEERGLARRLKVYGIKSKTVRVEGRTPKGYDAADFADAWKRYLPSDDDSRHKRNSRHKIDNEYKNVADVADVADISEDFEERAAILEYDGGLTREEAEAQALVELPEIPEFLRRRRAS